MHNNPQHSFARKLLGISLGVLVGAGSAYSSCAWAETADATTGQAATDQTAPSATRAKPGHFPGWENSSMGHIAHYAGQLLTQHLQAAQQALDSGKTADAEKELEAAQHLSSGIREMMPFTVVVDQIKDVKQDLLNSDSAILVGDLLPVYKSIEQMELYAPQLAQRTRGLLKQAEKSGKAGDKETALQNLDELADTVSSTTVYLPVIYVSSQINAAMKAMTATPPDLQIAKAATGNALSSLTAARSMETETAAP